MSQLQITEIIPGLSLVAAENGGRFPFAHSFLVEGDTCALIDTGCGESVIDALQNERAIDLVIASHSHPDHTALNWKFAGKPIYAPQYAADTFGDFDVLGERFTEPRVRWQASGASTLAHRCGSRRRVPRTRLAMVTFSILATSSLLQSTHRVTRSITLVSMNRRTA